MKGKPVNILSSLPVQLLCRLLLGGIFIYASIDKIAHPHAFAKIIHNYHLLPDILIYVSALVLPWLELLTGIFLIAGIYKRTAAMILSFMLLVFAVAISINLIRGLEFDCGCFSTVATSSGSATVFLLIRDILLLIPGMIVIFFQRRKT
jgi:uncharacterized membrane protein YphA (DoxX/SURF4 family)